MNARPSPHTHFELKQRLAEEQEFYERYGDHFAPLTALRGMMASLSRGLEAAAHALRTLSEEDRQRAA